MERSQKTLSAWTGFGGKSKLAARRAHYVRLVCAPTASPPPGGVSAHPALSPPSRAAQEHKGKRPRSASDVDQHYAERSAGAKGKPVEALRNKLCIRGEGRNNCIPALSSCHRGRFGDGLNFQRLNWRRWKQLQFRKEQTDDRRQP